MSSYWATHLEPRLARFIGAKDDGQPPQQADPLMSVIPALSGYIAALTSPCASDPRGYLMRLRQAQQCLDNAIWANAATEPSPIGVPIPPTQPDPALVVVSGGETISVTRTTESAEPIWVERFE